MQCKINTPLLMYAMQYGNTNFTHSKWCPFAMQFQYLKISYSTCYHLHLAVQVASPDIVRHSTVHQVCVFCVKEIMSFQKGFINALWRKPLRNLELKILPKWWPWLPFSQDRIISDENIWMLSPLQLHFQFLFGDELKTVSCSSQIQRISCNSNRLRKGCA